MTTLIGRRCTHRKVFSRRVLIGRGLEIIYARARCEGLGGTRAASLLTISGGFSGGVTPVPIPNTEVKPASADGTWGETPWESRSPPDSFSGENPGRMPGVFVVLGGDYFDRPLGCSHDATPPRTQSGSASRPGRQRSRQ